ncbi:hypothetical protein C0995_002024 [Termitomyces sp. Mi166|nr:hypothetical protein C0995_002024 [Termitomyces sp. Mi166\
MSSIARYLASALSRLSLFGLVDSPAASVTPRTPQSSHSVQGAPCLARGLILSTSPYLKSAAADPKVSLTPAAADTANTSSSSFDVSFSSDTSTSSSCSDDTLITPLRSLDTNDLFSPRRYIQSSSFPVTPSPPYLVGLGISGVPRRDGKPGDFDGLGLVGVRRSFNPKSPSLVSLEDDDDDDGYASPTPVRVHKCGPEKHYEQERDDELSETFIRELVFTWESDPQHTRMLCTIPECDDEDELEFQKSVSKKEIEVQPASSPEPTSSASFSSPSSSRSCSAVSPSPPPTPPHLTLRAAARPYAAQALKSTNQPKTEPGVSGATLRKPHRCHTRSKSSSPPTVAPTRGRTIMRVKNPSGSRSGRDDGAVAAQSKKKPAIKGTWRI